MRSHVLKIHGAPRRFKNGAWQVMTVAEALQSVKPTLLMLAALTVAAFAASTPAHSCSAPMPAPLPTHGEGGSTELRWQPVSGASAYLLWAQWRVPEAEVLKTLELSTEQPQFALPASPAPDRLLKLQVELISLCADGTRSRPALLRQFQQALAGSDCPPPQPLPSVREPGGKAVLARWQAQAHERFELRWEAGGHDAGAGAMDSGDATVSEGQWRLSSAHGEAFGQPWLMRVQRLCSKRQRSAPTYWLVP